jgi:hypothetical protein
VFELSGPRARVPGRSCPWSPFVLNLTPGRRRSFPGRRCPRSHSGRRSRGQLQPPGSRRRIDGSFACSASLQGALDVLVARGWLGHGRRGRRGRGVRALSEFTTPIHAVRPSAARTAITRSAFARLNPPLQVLVGLPPWRTFSYQHRLAASLATEDSGSHALDGVAGFVSSSSPNAIRRRARGISIWRS